jgi:signal transduction histidine kinase
MTIRLEHDGKVYGIMGVILPSGVSADEDEQSLFNKVGADIAYALYAIEVEEERKLDADALERHRQHLEELVQERTAELKQAQENLVRREKLATLGQIAGSVAHEIRNPLGAIRNAVYYLKMALGQQLEGKPARHLQIIENEIERSNRVITSLLDFARGRECSPRPCRLADILAPAIENAGLPAGIDLDVVIPDDLPALLADPGQISEVFQNLLVNASQALEGRGRIQVRAVLSDGVVTVDVADSGPGIPPENINRVFEPLFSTRAFGVGLGLPICRSFVEANRGKIEVKSEPGKGTTVTVLLPVADPGP